MIAKYSFSTISVLRAGARYDYGSLHTEEHFDWYQSPIRQEGDETIYEYEQRAGELSLDFSNFSWSVGYNYTPSDWILKLNVGKSFRMPTPQELAADGLNYHYFRFDNRLGHPSFPCSLFSTYILYVPYTLYFLS
ncbi:MAG: TonB-dependent receptor [Okeania sp. SIO3C4]|nr:TonB-dependent receptor [Okeania sp. SIO3C4]